MVSKEEQTNKLALIPKAENYIEYMLQMILKLPRTEKYSIGTEYKQSLYIMLKDIIYLSKIQKECILEKLNEIDEYKYSRIPIYEETIDNIKGIVLIKDILKALKDKKKIDTKKLLKEVHFVPESVPIHKLFKQLQKNKMQMAIVIDEYGGTAGLVTMEDILEELVGNIFDEHDEEELEYKLIDENTYMVNGNISIGDLEKIIGIEISDGDYETLSGYLLEKLEELPMEGEETIIEDEKLTYKIEEYEDKRIKQVKICKNK